jgi:LysM repeat protein
MIRLRWRAQVRALAVSGALLLGGAALVWSAGASPRVHVVKQGETLSGLAQRFGVKRHELAAYNELSADAKLLIGQRLRIPPRGRTAALQALDPAALEEIQNANVRTGRWKYIVIHHSGVPTGTVQGMDRYHREQRHMENGLAYHFVIGNGHGMKDGEIAVGHRWTAQLDGGHLASEDQNKSAIGICLVGDFEKDKPTWRQTRSLRALVLALLDRCDLDPDAVKTHQQINTVYTRCPGRHFPTRTFLKSLDQ